MSVERTAADPERLIQTRCRPLDPLPTTVAPILELAGTVPRWIVLDVYGTLLTSGAGELGVADRGAGLHAATAVVERLALDDVAPRLLERSLRDTIASDHRRARSAGIDYPEVEIVSVWQRCLGEWRDVSRSTAREAAIVYELAANPVWPMPGAVATLGALHAHGINLAIVSNAQFYTPLVLRTLFGCELHELGIVHAVWSYREGRAKPDPGVFRALLTRLPRRPAADTCLYVGNDMLNDVTCAQSVGMRAALFAGDARSLRLRDGDPRVQTTQPDAILTSLRQIGTLVQVEI